MKKKKTTGIDTRLVTAGRAKSITHGLVNPPVYRASTILFDKHQDLRDGVRNFDKAPFYGRMGTPTARALEQAMLELEGGAGCWLFPSGMAAIATSLLAALNAGDHLLMVDTAYEPTRKICDGLLSRFGVETTYYHPQTGEEIGDLFRPNTRAVFVESPGSLTFELQDIPAIAAVAHDYDHGHDACVIADNTWATPLYFNAFDHGADIVVHAITKYIGGHSDLMMGCAAANKRAWPKLRRTSGSLGQITSPDDISLALRGLRTLSVRLERHQKNALKVAEWLSGRPEVETVLHPAMATCPGHEIWRRDFGGATGLFSIILNSGAYEDIGTLVDGMKYFKMGFSWGGYESLILPANPAAIRTAQRWEAPGPLLRLHIGLEDPDDLIADLAAAFDRFAAS